MPAFDPYHKWLAIPPSEQPPNHYRLLGVPLFESDLDVIEAAAERQATFLRTLQIGPQAELAARILNEVARARVTLLNVDSKMGYDAALKQQRTETEQQSHTAVPHSRESAVVTPVHKDDQPDTLGSVEPLVSDNFSLPEPAAHSIQITTDSILASTGKRYQHKSRQATRSLMLSVLGGLAGICIVIILLWTFWGGSPSENYDHQPIVQQDSEDTPAPEPDPAPEPEPEPGPEPKPEPAPDPAPAPEPDPGDPPGPDPDPRLPVPDKDARTKAQALLDDLFKDRYDEAVKLPEPLRL